MVCIALIMTVSLIGAFAARPSLAADGGGSAGDLHLITSPLPILLTVKPGSTATTDLRIKNGGSHTERLKVDLLKFGAQGEEGQPALLDPEPGDEQFKWVSFSQNSFDAGPNEWKTIKMTVKVPKTAAFGYYYAVTFSRASKDPVIKDQKTALRGATAVLVLMEAVSPNAKREMKLADFVSKKGLYEYLPAEFKVRVYNNGNVHLAPAGSIFITKGNKPIGTIPINKDHGNVLPKSYRFFESQWMDGFPHYAEDTANNQTVVDKKGRQKNRLVWNLADIGKIRFGKYSASLVMVYDDGKRDIPLEATVSFWVIPWRFLLVAGLVISLMLAGIWAIFRAIRPKRRKQRRR